MGAQIGILGSGAVGVALAKGFIKHGHKVMIGTNTPSKTAELAKSTGASAGSFEDTARFGEMLVLAVKGGAAEEALKKAGFTHLKGKTVIDATNPIAEAPPVNGVIKYFTGPNDSLMERLQRLVPDANFVKSFSCIGSALMVNPDFGKQKPAMFICGNSEAAKTEVKGILAQFGFAVEDMGKVEGARAIEPLAMLWCIPGMLENRWSHAFALLKK
jgi:8-hydroxy-5-deazaflavin:NADPH oxidoreductase